MQLYLAKLHENRYRSTCYISFFITDFDLKGGEREGSCRASLSGIIVTEIINSILNQMRSLLVGRFNRRRVLEFLFSIRERDEKIG